MLKKGRRAMETCAHLWLMPAGLAADKKSTKRAKRGGNPLSFKLKLAVYFLLLAVLPLTAAFWGFRTVTRRAEERRVEARLGAELRAVLASYDRQLASVEAVARRLAADGRIQRGLISGRFGPLPPGMRIVGPHRLAVGRQATLTARRIVHVRTGSKVRGSIVAELPLDRRLLRRLRSESGLARNDRLVFVPAGRSGRGREKSRSVPWRQGVSVTLGGSRQRALATGPLSEQPRVQLAVLAPAAAITDQATAIQKQLLFVLLGGLLVLAAIASAEGRSIMRSVREFAAAAQAIGRGDLDRRVPVRGRDEFAALARSFNSMAVQLRGRLRELELQRGRLRDSLTRFGELLAATHAIDQLLPVIAAAAIEAAKAKGAVLITEGGAVVEVGELDDGPEQIELPIVTGDSRFGLLILHGPSRDEDDLAATRSLVAQAAVALENARLHEAVELQASSDGLTGLANRRRCEEVLAAETARSERYETPLALILCDIDDFKTANDSHGHAFGDLVLQEFAVVLRETLRDVDVAGRWGGEEFLVVLPGTELLGAIDAAERIRTAFASLELEPAAEQTVKMSASFGVASFAPGCSGHEFVAAADRALYTAKRAGKNRVEAAADTSTLVKS
jgi:diguanylate cyclase (GGDEF)-like protein